MLLLSATMIASAQKMTIKTASGQVVEISCDGMMPAEVQVEGDKVTFKMNQAKADVAEASVTEAEEEAKADVAEAPVTEAEEEAKADVAEAPATDTEEEAKADVAESFASEKSPSIWGSLANGLAEELSSAHKAFNEEHANDNPQEVMTNLAKGLVGEEAYENVSFLSTLFSGLRLTKDTTFVPTYEQRKPKPAWRHFDTIELFGSFGKNISGVSEAVADKVDEKDYGDDTENENKFGGGIKYSRVYLKGREIDGKWKPNPLGLAWSWGGLVDYSYERDMGSYFSAMSKIGVQIGSDIAIGVDGLVGCGITPYNTFFTNGMNYSMLNKSAFCFKYGLQLWGCLNYSKDTYTIVYGRYIRSIKPSSAVTAIQKGWEMVLEDFDPSSWTVGLAVGYKLGAPKELSTDKRIQASVSTGYQFAGKQKGAIISTEIERLTKVSHSTSLSYGLSVEHLLWQNYDKERYTSVLFSAGFKVNQPESRYFWGAKLYAGAGDCAVSFGGEVDRLNLENNIKKLSAKAALQLNGGIKLGKLSELFGACRFGCHFGKSISVEGIEDPNYVNLKGFEADAGVGYRYTF